MNREKRNTTTKIPKSKAKTAYGLLGEIRALIVAEPKRYNQRDTLAIRGTEITGGYDDETFPRCGTIGCVAGWVTMLTAKDPSRVEDVVGFAQRTLGLDGEQEYALFNSEAAGRTRGGSQEHAQSGADHIASFQRKHRTQLLVKKVAQ